MADLTAEDIAEWSRYGENPAVAAANAAVTPTVSPTAPVQTTPNNTDAEIKDWSGYGRGGGAQVGLLGRIFGSDDPSTVDRSGLTSAERRAPLWGALTQGGLLAIAAGGKMYDYQRAPLLAQIGAVMGGIPDAQQKAQTAAAQRKLLTAQVPEANARTALYGAQADKAKLDLANQPLAADKIRAEIEHLRAQGRYNEAEALRARAQAAKAQAEADELTRPLPEPVPPPGGVPAATPDPLPTPVPPPAATPAPGQTEAVPPPGGQTAAPPPVQAAAAAAPYANPEQAASLGDYSGSAQGGDAPAPATPAPALTPAQQTITKPVPPSGQNKAPEPYQAQTLEPTYTSGPYSGLTYKQAVTMKNLPPSLRKPYQLEMTKLNTTPNREQWDVIAEDERGRTLRNKFNGDVKVVPKQQTDAEKLAFEKGKKDIDTAADVAAAGPKAEAAQTGTDAAKNETEMHTVAEKARNSSQQLDLAKRFNSDSYTGPASDLKVSIGQWADQFGISTDRLKKMNLDPGKLVNTQTFQAVSRGLALEHIGTGGLPGNSFSNTDRTFIEQMVANPKNDADTNRLLIDIAKRVAQQRMDTQQAHDDWKRDPANKGKSFRDFESDRRVELRAQEKAGTGPFADYQKADKMKIPPAAVLILKERPETAGVFNKTYGDGAAAEFLGSQ